MRNFFLSALVIILTDNAGKAASSASFHPFYVSIIDIDHNPQTESLELTFKIFTDDLENGIEDEKGVKLKLATSEQVTNADQQISSYLMQHFNLLINGEKRDGSYLGFEPEYDVTRIYVEYKNVSQLSLIEIQTDILIHVLPDQTNIVHVNYNGETKSLMLNAGNRSGNLAFK